MLMCFKPHSAQLRSQKPVQCISDTIYDRLHSHFLASTSSQTSAASRNTSGRKLQRVPLSRASLDADQPWKLMGRVINEDKLHFLIDNEQARLVVLTAANCSGLERAVFDSRLEELLALLPGFDSRIRRIRPQLLAALCADTRAIANKLLQLREIFPTADISQIVCKRPSLLLEDEFKNIGVASQRLQELFGEDADRMVEQQPLLLSEDIDVVIEQLQRSLRITSHDAALSTLAADLTWLQWVVVEHKLRGASAERYLQDCDEALARLWQWNNLPRSQATLIS